MSYVTPRHTGLGGFADVATAATKIVEDPCLPRVATLVLRLHELTPAPAPRPGQPKPPPSSTPPKKGIGLCMAVKPLEAVVWMRERPWIVPVAGAAVVGGLIALGFAAGKRSSRR